MKLHILFLWATIVLIIATSIVIISMGNKRDVCAARYHDYKVSERFCTPDIAARCHELDSCPCIDMTAYLKECYVFVDEVENP